MFWSGVAVGVGSVLVIAVAILWVLLSGEGDIALDESDFDD